MRKYSALAVALTLVALVPLTTAVRSHGPKQTSVRGAASPDFTVNSLGDTSDALLYDGLCADSAGACTLRAAIQQANFELSDATVGFNVTGVINLAGALPDLTTDMTIGGPGAGLLTVRRDTGGEYRIFRVVAGVTATISGLTVSNGRAQFDRDFMSNGGGIYNSGVLTLSDCAVSGNSTIDSSFDRAPTTGGGGIHNDGSLTMKGCTVSNNSTGSGRSNGERFTGPEGGGIFNSGTLAMTNCVVSGNSTANALNGTAPSSGAFAATAGGGGGIRNEGDLTMKGCTVSNNSTGRGALEGRQAEIGGGGGGGGGVSNAGNLMMTDCTVSGNVTGRGGNADRFGGPGGAGGGIHNASGTATLTGCTVSRNRTGPGGGVFIVGVGIRGGDGAGINSASPGGSMTITNSTISGNSTGDGGSANGFGSDFPEFAHSRGGDGGGIASGVDLKLSNSTIVLNSTGAGMLAARGGRGGGVNGSSRISGTIVALNIIPVADEGRDIFGSFTSSGYNLVGVSDGGCCFNSTDQLGSGAGPLSPAIGPLANYGGPTQTHALLAGSPAIDKGLARDSDGRPVTTDQRGAPRPFDEPVAPPQTGGDDSDVGAFERQSVELPPTPTPTPTPSTTPTPSPTPPGTPTPTPTPHMPSVHLSPNTYAVTEGCAFVDVTIRRTGSLDYWTTEVTYVVSDGNATQRGDFVFPSGRVTFGPGEETKTLPVLISEDAYAEGAEGLTVSLTAVTGGFFPFTRPFPNSFPTPTPTPLTSARVEINDNETSDGAANPIDDAAIFVCQHYHDFLNRQGDASGMAFWTNQITECGTDAACRDDRRESVSAAFFLSIEFQQTGYFALRTHKVAFGDSPGNPRYVALLADTQQLGRGVVVGQAGWEQQLAANNESFLIDFVGRPEFRATGRLPRDEYVDALFANAGVTPTSEEREAALDAYGSGIRAGRARALGSVVESGSVYNKLYNQGFVLMQYFGYLRRNPDGPPDNTLDGYNFWLAKLNDHSLPGEDVRDETVARARVRRSEMVRAFIVSGEYRARFGGDSTRGNQFGAVAFFDAGQLWRRELERAPYFTSEPVFVRLWRSD